MAKKRLIDADEVLEQLKQAEKEMMFVTLLGCKAVDIKAVLRYIESRPAVDAVEVVHGRWGAFEVFPGAASLNGYPCSVCGNRVPGTLYNLNYCPNCGAKMDGDGNGC